MLERQIDHDECSSLGQPHHADSCLTVRHVAQHDTMDAEMVGPDITVAAAAAAAPQIDTEMPHYKRWKRRLRPFCVATTVCSTTLLSDISENGKCFVQAVLAYISPQPWLVLSALQSRIETILENDTRHNYTPSC